VEKSKILVIEDEDVCVTLLNLVVNFQRNYEVITAKNGEEGIQKALSEKPDLIFLDIMLPKINGFDVARRLRREPALSATPIVVVSARAGESGRKTAREVGCQEFITKPFKVRQIKDVIGRYLKQASEIAS
jgi:DNA-binding response OmpR family regulator